jgi:hypothetical protein
MPCGSPRLSTFGGKSAARTGQRSADNVPKIRQVGDLDDLCKFWMRSIRRQWRPALRSDADRYHNNSEHVEGAPRVLAHGGSWVGVAGSGTGTRLRPRRLNGLRRVTKPSGHAERESDASVDLRDMPNLGRLLIGMSECRARGPNQYSLEIPGPGAQSFALRDQCKGPRAPTAACADVHMSASGFSERPASRRGIRCAHGPERAGYTRCAHIDDLYRVSSARTG